jgi:hypothetical protein
VRRPPRSRPRLRALLAAARPALPRRPPTDRGPGPPQAGLHQPSTQGSQVYGGGMGTLMGGAGDFSQASFGLGPADDVSHLINLDSLLSQVRGPAAAGAAGLAAGCGLPGRAAERARPPPCCAAAGDQRGAVHRPGHRGAAGRQQGRLSGERAAQRQPSQRRARRASAPARAQAHACAASRPPARPRGRRPGAAAAASRAWLGPARARQWERPGAVAHPTSWRQLRQLSSCAGQQRRRQQRRRQRGEDNREPRAEPRQPAPAGGPSSK